MDQGLLCLDRSDSRPAALELDVPNNECLAVHETRTDVLSLARRASIHLVRCSTSLRCEWRVSIAQVVTLGTHASGVPILRGSKNARRRRAYPDTCQPSRLSKHPNI